MTAREIDAAVVPTGRLSLSNACSALAGGAIRLWLRLFGRRVDKADAPWLAVPIGGERIGDAIYAHLVKSEGLRIVEDGAPAGLMADFDDLRGPQFDPSLVRPEIRHFYEQTSLYQMEAWSETSLIARVFLWLLVT